MAYMLLSYRLFTLSVRLPTQYFEYNSMQLYSLQLNWHIIDFSNTKHLNEDIVLIHFDFDISLLFIQATASLHAGIIIITLNFAEIKYGLA